jgi:hypothetical protein
VQDKKQRDLDKRKAAEAEALKASAAQGMNGSALAAPGNMLAIDDQDELF